MTRVRPFAEEPCDHCHDVRASAAYVRALLGYAERDDRWIRDTAVRRLGLIADPRAAPVLREAVRHTLSAVRAAAWTSLGGSGDTQDVPAALKALDDEQAEVRHTAIGALVALAGTDATDVLLARVHDGPPDDVGEAMTALAWLRDERVLGPARALAREELSPERPRRPAAGTRALVRLGTAADRAELERLARGDGAYPDTSPDGPWWTVYSAWFAEDEATARAMFACAQAERRAATGQPSGPIRLEPLLARTVAKLVMGPPERTRPIGLHAQFGGQPLWRDAPTWPMSANGTPFRFYGQIPLDEAHAQTAYIFADCDEGAATWEPFGGANALVVQPGAPPSVATEPRATGPGYFEPRAQEAGRRVPRGYRPWVRYCTLKPGVDPPEWTYPETPAGCFLEQPRGDWSKVGGTPLWLQGAATLGDEWVFAFQFDAAWVGQDLADGAICSAFVTGDGRGAFLWQCH